MVQPAAGTNTLHFQQLLAGREFARRSPVASQMANFVYLIGDTKSRECVFVDPAWDVQGLYDLAVKSGYTPVGALVTHYHPDHVGGHIFGMDIEGLANLIALKGMKVYVNKNEADGVKAVTGLSESDMKRVESGDSMRLGDVEIRFLHTPGHTPGSQCFLIGNRLVSGDTLFIGGCGRVDLPGGDAEQLYESLTKKLATLPDDTVLYPGHDYSDRPTSTIGDEKRSNLFMRMGSLDDWLCLRGAR